jgi:hypothetical protein
MLHPSVTVPGVIAGGALSGFACFSTSIREAEADDDDEDWRRSDPPPEDPPPPTGVGDGPFDWMQFDRLRAQWERVPTAGR